MLVPLLVGLITAMTAALLRMMRGKPARDELEVFTLRLVLAFIDGFMIAYLGPFLAVFVAKLSFHLFLYMLFASLTAVLYASYRSLSDIRVYAIAMAPWFFILLLVVATNLLGSRVIFVF